MPAQNLVPNYNFENLVDTPTLNNQLFLTGNWFNPCNNGPPSYITPDFFYKSNISSWPTNEANIPKNGWGFQNERKNKNGYAGIVFYHGFETGYKSGSEYISTSLTSVLQSNTTYIVGFYCSLSNVTEPFEYLSSKYAIDRLGMYFSNAAINSNTDTILPYTPQWESPAGYYLTDTANWMLVWGTFVAQGGEQFVTIGNFRDKYHTNALVVYPTSTNTEAYYYIDDVFVYPLGSIDTARAGNDTTICNMGLAKLGSHNYADYEYHWYPSTGLSCDTCGITYAKPTQTTTYKLFVEKYRQTWDSVTIVVQNCNELTIPNAFTPNADGVNDVFRPKETNFKSIDAQIINRWGNKIYSWNKTDGYWNGKTKDGTMCSSGTYFYVITVTFADGSVETRTGSVTLANGER